MTYREESDPHETALVWRVVAGVRWWRWWGDSQWYRQHRQHPERGYFFELWDRTPERIAMWADLVLNPYA